MRGISHPSCSASTIGHRRSSRRKHCSGKRAGRRELTPVSSPKSAFLIPTAISCATSSRRTALAGLPHGPAITPISTPSSTKVWAYGIIGCAVGSAFAVLVAEELFASGCQLLLSVTSAGQVLPVQSPPYFIVIDRALRDEGTSYHYLPPTDYSSADRDLVELAKASLTGAGVAVRVGATWTTDAPFRETAEAIAVAREAGILAVEMEAAALYAFAEALHKPVSLSRPRHQPNGPR